MTIRTLQDILPLVEQPSRYLGSEVNAIRKDHGSVKLRVALAFPDLYEIGMSHFGLQILYFLLNRNPDIVAERVFAPAIDMEAYLRSGGIPLVSLETHTPIHQFDMVGFSLLYELNYTNVLTMLDLAQIPFQWSRRNDTHPLIIAGGPCTCNPEPMADFFDAMVVGDGEEVIQQMTGAWIAWKAGGDGRKETLLNLWADLKGVYVPAFFTAHHTKAGHQVLQPADSGRSAPIRAVISDLDQSFFPEAPIVPFGKPIHDRLRLEVARGCTRGCRFCQAGMIYRPVRERSMETLIAQSIRSLDQTGYGDLSLLSLSTGDYRSIVPLMEQLMDRCQDQRIAVSLPSIRAGTLTPKLMKLIKQVRKTGFTIAPEAGSQRLRDVINKNITADDIRQTVENALSLGWQVIKLYFMVGLPTETDADISALLHLVQDLWKIKGPKGKKIKINVSIASFIPKPHTPFQWHPQISLSESKRKIQGIKTMLRKPGIQVKWQNPEMSILEGLWARGDRRLGGLLASAYEKGCRFDGWSDQFRFDAWQDALSETGIDMDFYTTRVRDLEEPLPWDPIDMRLSKSFLVEEWRKALNGERTEDCRDGDCQGCGGCDFIKIQPTVFNHSEAGPERDETFQGKETVYTRMMVTYEKMHEAKYFGHLELRKMLLRAIRRAQIPVKYSQGFHPMPKVAFDDPLPVGVESRKEVVYMTVADTVSPETMVRRINSFLPQGLKILSCQPHPGKPFSKRVLQRTYEISLTHCFFDKNRLKEFDRQSEWIFNRRDRKGRALEIDLKPAVALMDLRSSRELKLMINATAGKTPRVSDVLASVFDLSDEAIKQARVVRAG